jgi:hypothetical protein
MRSNAKMEKKLAELASWGILQPRTEKNRYLKVSYKGTGGSVTDKWNVKIYTSGAVVCTDEYLLKDLLADKLTAPTASKVCIECDDAGWGFPLSGVMCGITDGKRVVTTMVGVEFFQDPLFKEKAYLKEYGRVGFEAMVQEFGVDPHTHRIELCTGVINNGLRETLREKGYEVRSVEIKGLLQDRLEDLFREHIHNLTGRDMAYDPKVIAKEQIAKRYWDAVKWGRNYCPDLLKSGWRSLKK